MTHKAHSIKLYPTKPQEILLKKSCGVARYSYNWALTKWKELYDKGESPSAYSLIKLQNSIKKEQMPFFLEVSKNAPQYAIRHLELAYKKMWRKQGGFPRYKKKGVRDSFVSVEKSQDFKQSNYRIHLPRIGEVKCAENIRFSGKVNHVTVRRVADMWFAVVSINTIPDEAPKTSDNQAVVGVDLGIKSMMALSNGKVFANPLPLKSNTKRLKQHQRSLSRKQIGSNNYFKQNIRLIRLYYRISRIRANAIHEATSYVVNNFGRIVIEDLNALGMVKNHKLAQVVHDTSFGEIRRQLTYKASWKGRQLVVADRWYPSSKICSGCGHKKDKLKLSERTYTCENCGLVIDRDLNAAINLANYRPTQKACECEACGELSSVAATRFSGSLKQEISNNHKSFSLVH